MNLRQSLLQPLTLLLLLFSSIVLMSAQRNVLIQVQDPKGHPLVGVEVGINGIGGSRVTGDDGKALLSIGNGAKEGDLVSLAVLHSPKGKDYVLLSPWDSQARLPPFAPEPGNYIHLVLIQRGDRTSLESGDALALFAADIVKAQSRVSTTKSAPEQNYAASLVAVAKHYGLKPDELDSAIRSWGARAGDPYASGLAALYGQDYSHATDKLEQSLQSRESKLENDLAGIGQDREGVAQAAFFLGFALHEQGRYREALAAYKKGLRLFPQDPLILNSMAITLASLAYYRDSETLFRQAIALETADRGAGDPSVALGYNNLAQLLRVEGKYPEAETLLHRALEINQKRYGPFDPNVATNLNNLALLLQDKGFPGKAEPLFRQALLIEQKTYGPYSPLVALAMNNLAGLLQTKGDVLTAESLYRKALSIDEKALGMDHPSLASILNNLAELLRDAHKYPEAEEDYRRALSIKTQAVGNEHPEVAIILHNLAELFLEKHDYANAKPLLQKALAIDEKMLGENHPDVAVMCNSLGTLLEKEGDFSEAERLFVRALTIDQRQFGENSYRSVMDLFNLDAALRRRGDSVGAQLYRDRAIAISERVLGASDPNIKRLKEEKAP